MNINMTVVKQYLTHLAILGGLAAGAEVLTFVIAALTNFNITSLPPTYQAIAYLALPMVLAAANKLASTLKAQLQVQEAQNAATAATAEATAAKAQLAEANAKLSKLVEGESDSQDKPKDSFRALPLAEPEKPENK